ncbi:MAG: HAMP domain-containing histidine kinase [Streptomycetaceae bacterium]|nr:HAMP domain-containing histidine kinase [Streptomycetaceae bacterium]
MLAHTALVLLAGGLLLGITYGLVAAQLPNQVKGSPGCLKQVADAPGTSVPCPGDSGPPADDNKLMAQVAAHTRDQALNALLTQGGMALAATGLAALALAWLIASRLLRPLSRITETAERIAEAPAADRGLHERIALDGPADELKKLADTFDVMLARLDQSFDGQRRFIANASHELRTPLSLNQALIEVVLQRPGTTPEVQQLGETLLDINQRHERLIDGLLLLAQSEREVEERSFVDLADIVEHVVALTPADRAVVTATADEAPTTGNPVLERLVQNLVENGVRYNVPHGGRVHVASGLAPDGSARVRVANTGPVVPRYEIPGLFEPFRRLGTQRLSRRTAGAGLGLSIVRAVARAHGGDVEAEPHEGGGLVVTVTLPPAAAVSAVSAGSAGSLGEAGDAGARGGPPGTGVPGPSYPPLPLRKRFGRSPNASLRT